MNVKHIHIVQCLLEDVFSDSSPQCRAPSSSEVHAEEREATRNWQGEKAAFSEVPTATQRESNQVQSDTETEPTD